MIGIGLPAVAGGTVATVAAIAAAACGWGALVWSGNRERQRADRADAGTARLEAALDACPLRYVAVDDGQDGLDSLIVRLTPPAAAAVTGAVRALRDTGAGFRLETVDTGGRRLILSGMRGGAGNAAVRNVVWIHDVSDDRAAVDAAAAARDRALEEVRDLRAALDALPVPVWLRHGGDGSGLAIAWCNRAFARAVDADAGQAVAEGRELLPGGTGRALAERARANGFAQSERVPVVIGTERRLLEVTEAPLPVADGAGVMVVGHALDLTAQEDLRTELERHITANAEVLERLGAAISVFGADTRLRFYNQAYVRLWDLDEGFLRGEPTHSELLEELRSRRKLPEHADFRGFKRERLARYTGLIDTAEELLHLPDGTALRELVAPHPLGGLIVVTEDVTNTLALESSYNTLIAVQQETLDNLAEGIAVFGGDGRLKLCNPSFARLWDLRDADLRGEPHIGEVFDRMQPFLDSGGDWDELKDEMIGATLERVERSGRLERTDGSVVEFSTVPLPDGAVLISYLDVTDSARLEQALRAANASLEAADQLKSEFIANVSHHLRTPLNSIIGFAEVLSNEYFGTLNARQAEYVKAVLDAGERLLTLVDDVVDLTSIGAGVTTLDHGPVDLPGLLESVAGLTREWARREGMRLEVVADGDLGHIDGDEKRLKQALFNLVVSAIRHPPGDGRIVLSARRTPANVVLSVGDGGCGPAAVPAAEHHAADGGASGLGLSLVRNIIELHGGRMDVDDGPGHGLRVHCTLPATPRREAA
ncbi:PAS-domain containing protein [Azospirillum halopraeferens]|uniref:PAS-domain containing protein n=1 Tax=Azospirillum halopraeferens TaxID=34010 RepID=UPI000424DEAB|nr:PAS-domain containing protein [Azospirillum halopraeferens]